MHLILLTFALLLSACSEIEDAAKGVLGDSSRSESSGGANAAASSGSGAAALSGRGIVSLSPKPNSTKAPRNARPAATFHSPMRISGNDDCAVCGLLTGARQGNLLGDETTTITLAVRGGFQAGEEVETTLTTALQGMDGRSLSSPFVWRFRVATRAASAEFDQIAYDIGDPKSATHIVAVGDIDLAPNWRTLYVGGIIP